MTDDRLIQMLKENHRIDVANKPAGCETRGTGEVWR